MSGPLTFLAGAAAGAAAVYFLDPQGGAERRTAAKDKTMTVKSKAPDAAERAKQAADKARGTVQDVSQKLPAKDEAVGKARGAVQGVTKKMPGKGEATDDVTLARKVESEIFRSADAPKGSVSVNAENGVVFLRGVVEDQQWIDRLGGDAQQVDGVKEVRNLLHLPGTDAPVAPATQ